MTKNQNASKFWRERDQQGAIWLRIPLVQGHWDYLGNEPSCQKGLWVQAKQSQKGKKNPWHLRLYSYCINWTHYAMIGFFCWVFFRVFFPKCLSFSFRIVLWGLLLYLSRLLGQMHEFQIPHQECIKHWMRMGGTNQIMWAELEFILICYIP